ncbi:hypothetical protein QBC36DRAFT_328379 [Triangularia setosa]|uniref:Uncharacterized protein n=1 Tax=Triangularia setosa TaxID=2587417 RepID=A0AAN6W7W6_9PEZI|nr:hypothetical protein QBC36DRAFT_328379 [Podospora setosa]
MALRSKEHIYRHLPSSGFARFLLVKPSSDLRSPLHCNVHPLPITQTSYDYLIPPIQTRKKTRPFFLDDRDARMHFEIEICLRYMRHETKEQMFWIHPLCSNNKNPVEVGIHCRQKFNLINNANRVRGFLGEPAKRWDIELVANTLRQMHAMAGNTSSHPQNFETREDFKKHYKAIRELLFQSKHSEETKIALEQGLDLLCNAIWRERWTFLQTAGVLKDIDLYVGSTPIQIDAFYTLADFLCQTKSFNAWGAVGQLGKDNTLNAACRISQHRRKMFWLMRKWKSQIVENRPLPGGLEHELQSTFRRREKLPSWKKSKEEQELRLVKEIQKEIDKVRTLKHKGLLTQQRPERQQVPRAAKNKEAQYAGRDRRSSQETGPEQQRGAQDKDTDKP